jgi:thiamine-phosphate pyrophosphorylase
LADQHARTGILRILDASINRAGEGLRTLEDYARFALDDAGLAEQAKQLRHQVTAAVACLPREALLAARDTPGDCGTQLETAGETHRASATAVCQAAAVRTQQALRSIEEYGKCFDPALARQVEAIRYRCYPLAAALELVQQRRSRLASARLYVLVDCGASETTFAQQVGALIAGGVDVIQLRDKAASDRQLLERARQAMALLRGTTATTRPLLVINDRPDLAIAAGADGVHVGQDELPVEVVRRLVGPQSLVGVSTHTLDQVDAGVAGGADYLGCGPTFPSRTKAFQNFPGLDFLAAVAQRVTLPAFAIGGIDLENLGEVLATGIQRVAVAGAITTAVDPQATAAALRHRLEG